MLLHGSENCAKGKRTRQSGGLDGLVLSSPVFPLYLGYSNVVPSPGNLIIIIVMLPFQFVIYCHLENRIWALYGDTVIEKRTHGI